MKKLMLAVVAAVLATAPAFGQSKSYEIVAPAAPGGGWDQTARAMQDAMQRESIATAQVMNVPGAGGTIGLAQFASNNDGDPTKLLVGGYVMVGAILTNGATTTLDDVTPIARLTGEYEALVVPAASEIQDIGQLIELLKADPTAVTWGGGSAGGTDNIAAAMIAKAVGVDPTMVNYIAYSGGGEALAAILGGQVTVGISSLGEFRSQIDAGALRILAISSPEPVAGLDAPTLIGSGVAVDIQNWRMVAAPSGLSDDEVAAVTQDVEAMVNSATWQDLLKTRGWENTYLAGEPFRTQLSEDIAATGVVLKDLGLVP